MSLIGGNAVGKTTLFNIIFGYLTPSAGEILYRTENRVISLIGRKPHEIARLGIGRLFQDDHIFPNMSILDNMLVSAVSADLRNPWVPISQMRPLKEKERVLKEKVRIIFDGLFGEANVFWEHKSRPAGFLSFGQQRLLAIARLYMSPYKLILMDEPTSGVDPEHIEQVIAITRRLVTGNGATVFLIEHNMEVVFRIADFCCFMSQGKIAAIGTPADVIGNDDVRRTYLGV